MPYVMKQYLNGVDFLNLCAVVGAACLGSVRGDGPMPASFAASGIVYAVLVCRLTYFYAFLRGDM